MRTVDEGEQSTFVPPHMPSFEESGLGRVEYDETRRSAKKDSKNKLMCQQSLYHAH